MVGTIFQTQTDDVERMSPETTAPGKRLAVADGKGSKEVCGLDEFAPGGGHARIGFDAEAKANLLGEQVGEPGLSNKLSVGDQTVDAVGAKDTDEALQNLDTVSGSRVAPSVGEERPEREWRFRSKRYRA